MTLTPFSISGLLLVITCFALTLILLIYGRSKLHRIWTLFNIAVGIWGFGSFLIGKATTESAALFDWRLSHIGVIFIGVFFFHVTCVFCEISRPKTILFAYLQGFFFLLLNATNLFISRVEYVFGSFYYTKSTGPFYPVFFLIWVCLVTLGHIELIKFFKKAHGIKRYQTLYLFLGMLCGFSGGTTNFFPMFDLNIYPWGNFTIPIYCIIVTYATLRYRIVSIKEAIALTLAFLIICVPIIAIPFVVAYMADLWLFSLILATILAPTALHIYNRAKGRVLTERLAFQDAITETIDVTKHIRELDELLKALTSQIFKRLRLNYVGLYLLDPRNKHYVLKVTERHKSLKEGFSPQYTLSQSDSPIKLLLKVKGPIITDEISMRFNNIDSQDLKEIEVQLSQMGSSFLLPVFYQENDEEELMAICVLGERLSYKPYGTDELKSLNLLSEHIALTIRNAQYTERREKQAVRNVAVGAAHQMFNYLGNMMQAAESVYLLLKETNPEEFPEKFVDFSKTQLASVLEEGEKCNARLASILYEAKAKEEFKEVDIFELINHAVGYSAQLKSKDFLQKNRSAPEVINKIHKDFPHIIANEKLLGECLINLLNNAYDAITWKYPTLERETSYIGKIAVTGKDKPNTITISVEDNGIGMKKDVQDKIFAAYFTTKSSAGKGTGAGLYAVHDWVKQHGGTIGFKSEYGKGTTLTIELPKTQEGFNEPKNPNS